MTEAEKIHNDRLQEVLRDIEWWEARPDSYSKRSALWRLRRERAQLKEVVEQRP